MGHANPRIVLSNPSSKGRSKDRARSTRLNSRKSAPIPSNQPDLAENVGKMALLLPRDLQWRLCNRERIARPAVS
jgi:hypothetical protein